jgi:hypothetical protein
MNTVGQLNQFVRGKAAYVGERVACGATAWLKTFPRGRTQ